MAADEHPSAEAHLIGSLIESLSNTGEDDVFFSAYSPNSSTPQIDSSSEKILYDSTAMNLQSVPAGPLPPRSIPFQILHQLQAPTLPPQAPYWTPPPYAANSTMQFRGAGRPPFPIAMPPYAAANFGQNHGRWIPPPQHMYGPAPPQPFPPPMEFQQQYQAYLAYQQQMQSVGAVRPFVADCQDNETSRNNEFRNRLNYDQGLYQQYDSSNRNTSSPPINEQWESIYTPFGPVRSTGASFGDASISPAEKLPSSLMSPPDENQSIEPSISCDQGQLKKHSLSTAHPRIASASNEMSHVSSASSSIYPTTSSSTTTSSPSLPPKGRSYRDVAKSKTESGNLRLKKMAVGSGHESQELSKGNFVDQSLQDNVSPRRTTFDKKANAYSTATPRKLSMPARESSSDSISEFGGSENGLSSAPSPGIEENYAVVENFVVDLLDKRKATDSKRKGGNDASKLADRNVLKKNATTATSTSGDFQKIMRRKGSQTKLGAVQGRDSSPVVAAASRFAVLGKKSPVKSEATMAYGVDESKSNPIGQEQQRQQQRIKLNNEQTSPRFGSKSPTRKAAYINNDLTWPSKMKSTNRRNDDGDFAESDCDGDEGGVISGKDNGRRDLDDEDGDLLPPDDAEESDEGGGREQASNQKGDMANDGLKNRKKAVEQNQKYGGLKKGKAKRGDGGEMAKKRRQQRGVVMRWINWILTAIACYIRDGAVWLINLVTDIGHQLWEIAVYCTKSFCVKVSTSAQRAWYSTGGRLRKVILCIRQKEWSILLWWRSRRNRGGDCSRLGLEENIDLPNTGAEALRRLLSCRGQDAYSILGLRPDCTDDEVKCYYRRQAILVHPDKNACYGSDEAFKILAAAFELIGTPECRRQYDLQNLHKTKAMQDLQEMLAKLKEKMEELRSTMQCDCGGKHKRFPTDREMAYARYCRKCGEKHHAREGDIWAESHWFGFLWYYYACMEGVVYDITEWAGCQKNNLKHMKPNTHLVQYRLITGRNARQFHRQQQYGSASTSGYNQQVGEADGAGSSVNGTAAEDLMNRYWEDRLASTSGSGAAYLPPGAMSSTPTTPGFGGGMDFTTPTQSKFNPPACTPHGDNRPRKAGRRRKPRP